MSTDTDPTPIHGARSDLRRGARILALMAIAASGAAGCGGAAPPADAAPAAPASPAVTSAESMPTDVDGTVAALDRAESDLQAALGGAPEGQQKKAEPGEAERPAGGADALSSDPCSAACRALASMRRAANHLCGLTGDPEPRCDAARARLTRAEERTRASCPACAAP